MKIPKVVQQAINLGRTNETEQAKKKDAEPGTAASSRQTKQALSASTDRLLSAVNGTVGQLLKPKTGAPNQQAPAQGSLPSASHPGATGGSTSPIGSQSPLSSQVEGPGLGDKQVGADLGLQAGAKSILDRDLLTNGGSQVDGRNPNETYRGGSDVIMGNPFAGMDKGAAGDKPSLPGQSPSPLKPDSSGSGGGSPGSSAETNELMSDFAFKNYLATEGKGLSVETAAFLYQAGGKASDSTGAPREGGATGAPEGEGETPEDGGSTPSSGSGGSQGSSGSGGSSPSDGGTVDGETPDGGSPDSPDGGSPEGAGSSGPTDGGTDDGEASGGVVDDPPAGGSMTEDQGEDSYGHIETASDEFIQQYFDQKTQGQRGGSIDYGDGGAPQQTGSVDENPQAYAANYGAGYRPPTDEELEAARRRAEGALDPSNEVNET